MSFTILWWHWLIFGMLLVLIEMLIPSFTLFWFGLAAFLVALLLFFIPDLALSLQLICWSIGSIICTILWFKYFKPTMTDRTKAGITREAVTGETGIVIKPPHGDIRGVVRFSMPLLGSDEWEFMSHEACAVGDRVEVVDVSGNRLVVKLKNS